MRLRLFTSSLLPVVWLLLGVLIAVGLHGLPQPTSGPGQNAVVPPAVNSLLNQHTQLELEAQGLIPQPADAPAAHASNLLALPHDPNYAMAAFWFAGSREGALDVGIAMSLWSRASRAWTPAVRVIDRQTAGTALGKGILHIGNPVAWLDRQHRLHLFVVGTGLGGWAASRVLHLRQPTATTSFNPTQLELEPVAQLPLSWLWNLSHLVRHAPLPLADGGMVLPVYFEMGNKYPVFAWFSAEGDFLGMRQFTGIQPALQPALLALDAQHWLALLRTQTSDGHIGVLNSTNAGVSWHRQADLDLSNDDSAVASLRLPDGRFVMARNPAERGRSQLLMHTSQDASHWSAPQVLAEGVTGSEYAYPALSWTDDRLWISYTHQRQAIAWQRWRLKPSPAGQP
jgi:predicted neuraminidase